MTEKKNGVICGFDNYYGYRTVWVSLDSYKVPLIPSEFVTDPQIGQHCEVIVGDIHPYLFYPMGSRSGEDKESCG